MDLAALRMFKAVVDAGGLTRAAARVHCVQSNLSARIRGLEADLGQTLFERAGRRMLPTPEGRRLYASAARLLALADAVRAEVAGGGAGGLLRVGSMESTAATRLPALLARFHASHPAVQVELSTGTARALRDRLVAGDIDVAFAAGEPADPALAAEAAFREELVLVRPPRAAGGVSPDETTLIAFPAGCAYRAIVGDWLAAQDRVPPRVLELASYHAILACVAGGVGWSIVPRALLAIYAQRDLLRVERLPPRVARQTTWLLRRRSSTSASVDAFRALALARR
ncbi:MAG: LysR family transcriptional regulator [Burkholderiales bacterium]|nr:LysR family transcriptional regulator [Burkholderiales bacterium]